jgi:hypothetical protein
MAWLSALRGIAESIGNYQGNSRTPAEFFGDALYLGNEFIVWAKAFYFRVGRCAA